MRHSFVIILSAALMHLFLIGCAAADTDISTNAVFIEKMNSSFTEKNSVGLVSVSDGTHKIIYSLNESSAAQSFYMQLPLEIEVQNYGSNEKIFYPPEELDLSEVSEGSGEAGGLAYFSPWGNVVMYYDSFGQYPGLYLLGEAISGAEEIAQLTGTITVEPYSENQYTVQDVKNLQDFLLVRPTQENLSGKPYDLDGDGIWNVFDLCLMKREVAATLPLKKEKEVGVFDMESKTVMLNSGYEMPIFGLGTYSLLDDECVSSVTSALNSGVRLVDTAYMYHNEESVGEAVRNSGISREDIFVITKLYPNQFKDAESAIDEALNKLDIDYIDMMLLHHPGEYDVDAYHAMEKAVKDGKIRSLGLSNWYVEELENFLPQITIKPALVQNEIHPYYQENDVIPYIQSLGIVVQGWYPLGGRGHTAELLGDETITGIAENHGVSSAQVILRWNLQKGVVVIPGSSNPKHIQENTELFDFELTDNEMNQINALDRNEKHDWY